MPLAETDLVANQNYFVAAPHVVLRAEKEGGDKLNHLILGDWMRYLGETHTHHWSTRSGKPRQQTYAKVRCRGDTGWLPLEAISPTRGLEVNFVDIGQGDGCHIVTPDDKILLIDAGIGDNMERFLSWRYNLRGRNVKRAADYDPEQPSNSPKAIDYVVISHPDEDHYGGFKPVFENLKFRFDTVYHNGIVERDAKPKVSGVSVPYDLGGMFEAEGEAYLYDLVTSNAEMKKISNAHLKTRKHYLPIYEALYANSPTATVSALGVPMGSLATARFMADFDADAPFAMQILGPIQERVPFKGKTRTSLRKLGNEGETKNGHSVIFQGRYNGLSILLGGDLNSKSQNFLMQSYAGTDLPPDKVEKEIAKLQRKKQPLKTSDQAKLDSLEAMHTQLEATGRRVFEADVAKACHHGSQHIIDGFIRSVNASATVISSGDNEAHSHPRPDALGAYGKFGRGNRPLIFSTELARSTHEFTPQLSQYLALRGITLQIEAENDPKKKKALLAEIEAKKDRNVAVYGMITLRALGHKVIMAQKLEVARSAGKKWDIYELEWDESTQSYAYHGH